MGSTMLVFVAALVAAVAADGGSSHTVLYPLTAREHEEVAVRFEENYGIPLAHYDAFSHYPEALAMIGVHRKAYPPPVPIDAGPYVVLGEWFVPQTATGVIEAGHGIDAFLRAVDAAKTVYAADLYTAGGGNGPKSPDLGVAFAGMDGAKSPDLGVAFAGMDGAKSP